ncbi:hypothetical protein ABT338_04225, partial [Streptosporangium saharense]
MGSAVVTEDPQLPEEWWAALNVSLDALAAQHTNRVATPDTETLTQELVMRTIHSEPFSSCLVHLQDTDGFDK